MTLPNRQLVIGGYATLNIFVETGTEEQPIADTPGIQVRIASVPQKICDTKFIGRKLLTEQILLVVFIYVTRCNA